MNNTMTAFWEELKQAGIVSGTMPVATRVESPWYIRVMLGVSGWIAAVFLLGFLAISLRAIIENEAAAITVGGLCLAAAYAIFHGVQNDFAKQFGLALSLAGQALILFGLMEMFTWHGSTPWFITAGLQAIVAVVMPNFIQRLIAGYLTAFTLSVALTAHGVPSLIPVLTALLIAAYWLNEFHWRHLNSMLRPVAYGLTISLLQVEGQMLFENNMHLFMHPRGETLVMPLWIGELAAGVLLVAVVGRLFSQRRQSWTGRPMLIALLVTGAVAAVSLEAPGIATGLMVILLGFANGNRIVFGLGIAALLFYISAYYYTLQATLLTKAEILAVTGMALLSARWVASKWLFDHPCHQEEQDA